MNNDSKYLPQYSFNWKTQVKSETANSISKFKSKFNNYEHIKPSDQSNFSISDTDLCTSEYITETGLSEFLDLITVAYENCI